MSKSKNVSYKDYVKRASVYLPLALKGDIPGNDTGFGANKKLIPYRLFKYCSISDHYIDAIENHYLYMSPVEKLDDDFEVAIKFLNESFNDISEDKFEGKNIWYFLNSLKGINEQFDKELGNLKSKVGSRASRKKIDEYYRQEVNKSRKEEIWNEIESKINEPAFQDNINLLFQTLKKTREIIGIHSLTTFSDSQIMWEMYGAKREGMLIEYDIKSAPDNLLARLLPVNYSNRRDADPLKLLFDLVIMAFKGENNTVNTSFNKWLIDVICTKNKEWELQREWRVIGDRESLIPAPGITAIYLGSKLTAENRRKIIELSKKHGFEVYEQSENFETMKIVYKEMEEDK